MNHPGSAIQCYTSPFRHHAKFDFQSMKVLEADMNGILEVSEARVDGEQL